MTKMKFWKYQGAGNDFVMLDQRQHRWLTRENTEKIAWLCDRRFGIGADGLILLENRSGYDFEMIYFNADGRESTMCGNGGRCIAAFARHLGIIGQHGRFWAIDGGHEAVITAKEQDDSGETGIRWWVELKMSDVQNIEREGNVFILNTGSPHYIRFENEVQQLDMVREGRTVRYSDRFKNEGINVNLVHLNADGSLNIRTYERGVEDETLACGTGVTAAALASCLYRGMESGQAEIPVHARGGDLAVRFTLNKNGTVSDIWLCGPATLVFEGEIQI
ncbi:MAG: diaminopimelate epimerase [Haliscomenobacteraceae bacterium CHB4]|nr:Diaminopimelate epimerase [Saprospiraceae bacterium]MCE7924041.1 diaminopimelate epimerase [Haliscomenobacteraceae bacterium CHB4]